MTNRRERRPRLWRWFFMVLQPGKVFLFAKYREQDGCAVRNGEAFVRLCMLFPSSNRGISERACRKQQNEAVGWLARILPHESILRELYVDRMQTDTLTILENLERFGRICRRSSSLRIKVRPGQTEHFKAKSALSFLTICAIHFCKSVDISLGLCFRWNSDGR